MGAGLERLLMGLRNVAGGYSSIDVSFDLAEMSGLAVGRVADALLDVVNPQLGRLKDQ